MISVRVKDSRGSSGRALYSCEYPGALQGPDGENLRKAPGTSIRRREAWREGGMERRKKGVRDGRREGMEG